MITIISPTTTMNFDKDININNSNNPYFIKEAHYLIDLLQKLNVDEVSKLMNLSEDLSNLNYNRYQNYYNENTKLLSSIFAFDGEVFSSMNANEFNDEDLNFASEHLSILSGLYGILKPIDNIKPYRLEMKSKFSSDDFNNLYSYWKPRITDRLISLLDTQNENILVNLASSEYLKAIDLKKLKTSHKFIDIVFKDYDIKSDSFKTKGLYAKKARGYMVNYIIKNKIDDIKGLKDFDANRYTFNNELSNDETFVFTRK